MKKKNKKEKFGELKLCKICGKPTYFDSHISCQIIAKQNPNPLKQWR